MPLTDEQAIDFIKRGRQQGMDDAKIKQMIAAEGGVGMKLETDISQAASVPAGADLFPEGQKSVDQFIGQGAATVGPLLAAGPAAALGGAAARATIGRAIFPQASGIIGEMMGIGGVEAGRQALAGEEFSPGRVGIAALITGGVSSMTMAATRIFGAIGDISRSAQSRVAETATTPAGLPKALVMSRRLPRPRTNAQLSAGISDEFTLVERIRKALPGLKRGMTEARRQKVDILKAHDSVRIDPNNLADTIETMKIGKLAGRTVDPQAALFNRRVDKMATTLREMGVKRPTFDETMTAHLRGLPKPQVKSTGLTPLQVDELIREQFATKSYLASGKPGTTEASKAAEALRKKATELVNQRLPGDIAELNRRISEEMVLMEQANAIYGTGLGADRKLREQFILSLFTEGKAEEIKLLRYIDDRMGTKFSDAAFNLSTRRQFTGFFTTPSEGSGRPVKEALGTGARVLAGVTAPAQRLAGGAAGTAFEAGSSYLAFQNAMERARIEEDKKRAEKSRQAEGAGF